MNEMKMCAICEKVVDQKDTTHVSGHWECQRRSDILDLLSLVHPVVMKVWMAIGSDLLGCDPDLDNVMAMEGCIDADRLLRHGGEDGPAANELVREVVQEYGFAPIAWVFAETIRVV